MKKIFLVSIGISGILLGCLDSGVNGSSASGEGKTKDAEKTAWAASVQGTIPATNPYSEDYWVTNEGGSGSSGNGSMEKELNCFTNEVVTGFGARVSNGNVTGIRVFCTLVANGYLGNTRSTPFGGTPIEATVQATAGYVAVAVGGVVNGSAFRRAVITECPWISGVGITDMNGCRDKSSDGIMATETKNNRAYTGGQVVTGIGLTAGFESLKAVEVRIGHLLATPIALTNLSGNTLDFNTQFSAPWWANQIDVRTSGGTGDVDLYVGRNFVPDYANYTCASVIVGNSDNCGLNFYTNPSTYFIMLRPYAPYAGASLTVRYWALLLP